MTRRPRSILLGCLFATALAAAATAQHGQDGEVFRDFRAELILAIEESDLAAAQAVIEAGGAKEINRRDPSPLCEAVRLDNLQMVALMIRSGGDPNATEDHPLEEAIRNDSIRMVRLLFEAGARLEPSKAEELLQISLRGENALAIFRELLNRGAHIDVALRAAVVDRHLEATMLCLERGADVATLGELDVLNLNGFEPDQFPDLVALAVRDDNRAAALDYLLSTAAAAGERTMVDHLLAQGAAVSIEHLARAEELGRYETVLHLIEQSGLDLAELAASAEEQGFLSLRNYLGSLRQERINAVVVPVAGGVAALFVLLAFGFFFRRNVLQSPKKMYDAVRRNQKKRIEKLLEGGADPNGRFRGDPILNVATRQADVKVVRLLLRHGAQADLAAQPPSRDSGLAALHLAARGGNIALAEALLRHQAPIDAPSSEGLTPLYLAAASGKESMVQFLIERGADPNAQFRGRSLLEIAAGRNDANVTACLLEAGAEPAGSAVMSAPAASAPVYQPVDPMGAVPAASRPVFETLTIPPPDPPDAPASTPASAAQGSFVIPSFDDGQ